MSPSKSRSGPAGESNPDPLGANQVSSRWTSRPYPSAKVRPGFEPGPPPYRGGMPPRTPADRSSRPGRTRTCALLRVGQASWPLDHGTRWSRGSGCRTQHSEFMRLGRAPAHPQSSSDTGSSPEPAVRVQDGPPSLRRHAAPGAGIEPANSSLTGRHMNQLMQPRFVANPVSRGGRIRTGALLVPDQADCQAFPHPEPLKCPAGVEPALPPWQGGRLPLHHGHIGRRRIVKDGHRVGLEPPPGGSRVRCAAVAPRFRMPVFAGRVFRAVPRSPHFQAIGMAGFEPAVSWSQARRIAGLSHIPGSGISQGGRI